MTDTPEALVKAIKRKTRKKHEPEEKIRIVLEGLRGEESIAELCRRRRYSGENAFYCLLHSKNTTHNTNNCQNLK